MEQVRYFLHEIDHFTADIFMIYIFIHTYVHILNNNNITMIVTCLARALPKRSRQPP